jgi:hypothetical protein
VDAVLLAVIAACEIGFWVLLAAGMATRYLLRRPKAGWCCSRAYRWSMW